MNIVAQIKRYRESIKDRQDDIFDRFNRRFDNAMAPTCVDQARLLDSLKSDPLINLLNTRILELQILEPITFVVSDPDGTIRSQIKEAAKNG